MNNITNEQLDGLIKSAVNSSGPLPPDEKFSQIISALRELRDLRAMLQGAEPVSQPYTFPTKCWCHTCRPVKMNDARFVVCPDCGNKRCPHANDHRNACTGSNEPGQEGSAYPAAPQQEADNG